MFDIDLFVTSKLRPLGSLARRENPQIFVREVHVSHRKIKAKTADEACAFMLEVLMKGKKFT
jgi:hypothetical protein